ncbi:hypothetical protein H5410_041898 [Solanum commersonii]|uniref:Uncharacterized protein n=1 Tax=Solanum commersonii TaxID=4109 RepID=A0A9J5XW20_SOLCO|nr:hypothetical protein H5410_041898 [Solanum commersonii]
MEIPPSPLSPKYRFQLDSIYAVISETRGEASFEWGSVRRPFGGEKIRNRELKHAWSAFRVRVLSMLNFYSSCLRPYFGKVLDYDSMSLDIIEYPYLVNFFRRRFGWSACNDPKISSALVGKCGDDRRNCKVASFEK